MDRLRVLQNEIECMRKALNDREYEAYALKKTLTHDVGSGQVLDQNYETQQCQYGVPQKLQKWAIERYSRQILLPDIGVDGQRKLCDARVLVIGAGGLGCPAGAYLAGAGVGEIGIVDYDSVDLTNLHRQILHGEEDLSMDKVDSAANALRRLNSKIKLNQYNVQLDSKNALDIVSRYDIVLDCSDNVPTRYLLNDACVLLKVPLISGSALKMEGQLTIYNYRAESNLNEKDPTFRGPCYRCLFPTPPSPETMGSCSDHGVAGPVTGTIGALQALEAIKLIVGKSHKSLLVARMLIFDGDDITFRTVKMRSKNPDCSSCSDNPVVTELLDYETFCKTKAKENKKQEGRLKTKRRNEEKLKRMAGQSYLGFRQTKINSKHKWVQDVPKSERKMGPPCNSGFCSRSSSRFCTKFTEAKRSQIFQKFWNEFDWPTKRSYVKDLIKTVAPRRRRVKDAPSRKGDSKLYHLMDNDKKRAVCRVMFLNTLGVKEAMIRCWLNTEELQPKVFRRDPIKTQNVSSYIDRLPKTAPRCDFCKNSTTRTYLDGSIRNLNQLFKQYVEDMKSVRMAPASRKTFTKVFNTKNIGIFKPKNESDICDIVANHNSMEKETVFEEDINLNVEAVNVNTLNFNEENISTVYIHTFEQW